MKVNRSISKNKYIPFVKAPKLSLNNYNRIISEQNWHMSIKKVYRDAG